jgi:adenine/guanine phosphoribosyltransferase-like PRPP-binding protein
LQNVQEIQISGMDAVRKHAADRSEDAVAKPLCLIVDDLLATGGTMGVCQCCLFVSTLFLFSTTLFLFVTTLFLCLLLGDGLLQAAVSLVEKAGGICSGAIVVVELPGLKGRSKLPASVPMFSVLSYEGD